MAEDTREAMVSDLCTCYGGSVDKFCPVHWVEGPHGDTGRTCACGHHKYRHTNPPGIGCTVLVSEEGGEMCTCEEYR